MANNKASIMKRIIFILLACLSLTSLFAQVKQIPKEVRSRTHQGGFIQLEFKKIFPRDDFESWCQDNSYHISKITVSEIQRFGDLVTSVTNAEIIDMAEFKEIQLKLVLSGEKKVNCYDFVNSNSSIKGGCYICYDGYVKKVKVEDSLNCGLVNGTNTVSFRHKDVDISITSRFINGMINDKSALRREYSNGVEEIHIFNAYNGLKQGKYFIFSNDATPFIAMNFRNNKKSDRFYLYSIDSRFIGGEPIYNDYGKIGIYVNSSSRINNLFRSLEPILKCYIVDKVSSLGSSSTQKAAYEIIANSLLNLGDPTLQAFVLTTGKHEAISQLRKENKDSAEAIEFLDFIYCIISQF